jgi:hypothetical protein
MADEIIGMDDMMAIYEVTDRFGIDRESISVPLERQGSGSATGGPGGSVQITAPSTMDTHDWLPILQDELLRLGFEMEDADEPWAG